MTPVILRSKYSKDLHIYYALHISEGLDTISCDSFGSSKDNIILEAYAFPTRNFAKYFQEFMHDALPYDDIIEFYMVQCRSHDFIYPDYPSNILHNYLSKIIESFRNNKEIKCDNNDLVLKHFHHSIYDTSIDGKPSMSSAWKNKDLLTKSIQNRILYKHSLSQEDIQNGLNVSKLAPKPSVFSISYALLLFSSGVFDGYDNIIDPIAGFSGKLLASIIMNKKYTGIYDYGLDNNFDIRLNESQNLIEWVDDNFKDINKNIFNVRLSTYNECISSSKKYDIMICEIPYWNKKEDEKKYTDDIIDKLILDFKCKRYVFIIKDSNKYKEKYLRKIERSSHLYIYHRHIIVLDK